MKSTQRARVWCSEARWVAEQHSKGLSCNLPPPFRRWGLGITSSFLPWSVRGCGDVFPRKGDRRFFPRKGSLKTGGPDNDECKRMQPVSNILLEFWFYSYILYW